MPLIRRPADLSAPPSPPSAAPDRDAAKAGLRASDADTRWSAVRTLGGFADSAGALGEAALAETDPRVREAMFTALARIGTAQSVAALIPHLRADDAERRTGAMDALKAMPAALGAALPGLLADADADVRVLACDLARELPSAEATALLAGLLDGEGEVNVCAAAVDVLADIGGPAALPALRRCAQRLADPFLDFAIRTACDRIGQAPARG